MVPSIYPLETLHNSLSLKQVNEFLSAVCESAGDPHTRTTRGQGEKKTHIHNIITATYGCVLNIDALILIFFFKSNARSSVGHVCLTQPAIGGLVHPSEGPLVLHLPQVSL